jgi:ADP-ribose pyrophosphatase YjhB (NUDIX family)
MASDAPIRPQLAASAVVFRDGRILLVQRAREPGRGRYSLPGGRVEWGETVEQAVHREVAEETAITIAIVGLAGIREVLPATGGGHFVVLSYAARWTGGEVVLNDEHESHAWVAPDEAPRFNLTDGLMPIILAARALV